MRWMWIDNIVELVPRERMVAIKNVSLAEEHLHDHFPSSGPSNGPSDGVNEGSAMPIMPASLIIEGMAQTAGVLVGHAEDFRENVILAKVSRAELTREAIPGTTLRYTATITRFGVQGAATKGVVELLDHARPEAGYEEIGRIDLIFSHVDQNMAGVEFPEGNFVFGESFKTLLRTSKIECTV